MPCTQTIIETFELYSCDNCNLAVCFVLSHTRGVKSIFLHLSTCDWSRCSYLQMFKTRPEAVSVAPPLFDKCMLTHSDTSFLVTRFYTYTPLYYHEPCKKPTMRLSLLTCCHKHQHQQQFKFIIVVWIASLWGKFFPFRGILLLLSSLHPGLICGWMCVLVDTYWERDSKEDKVCR